MTNITVALEDSVLERLQTEAQRREMSLDSLVEEYLNEASRRADRVAEARRELLRLAATSTGRMRPDYKFDREESHER